MGHDVIAGARSPSLSHVTATDVSAAQRPRAGSLPLEGQQRSHVPPNFTLVYDWKKLLAALNADFPMLLRASKDGAKVIRGYISRKQRLWVR